MKPSTLLTSIACTGMIALVAQGVEAYHRYRPWHYSALKPRYDVRDIYSQTRGIHGTLSEASVHTFRREFADGQSVTGLYSALGRPNQSQRNRDVWMIQRVGIDGRPDGRYGRFIAEYRSDGRSITHAEW